MSSKSFENEIKRKCTQRLHTEFKALVVLSYTLTNTVSFMVACQTKVDINPPFSSLSQQQSIVYSFFKLLLCCVTFIMA